LNYKKTFLLTFIFCGLLGLFTLPIAKSDDAVLGNVITWDWLNVQLHQNPDKAFFQVQGGVSTFGFVNYGQIGGNETNRIYLAEGIFEFDVYSFSAKDIRDCLPNINYQAEETGRYAAISQWFGYIFQTEYYCDYKYSTIQFGTISPQTIRETANIVVGINPTWSDLDGTVINGVTIVSAVQVYNIQSLEVIGKSAGFCGDYQDLYTNKDPVSVGLTATAVDKDSASAVKVANVITTYNLGASTGLSQSGITLQQYLRYADGVGTPFTNPTTGSISIATNYVLQPEITYTNQQINRKYALILHDTFLGNAWIQGGITNDFKNRVTAVQFKNVYTQQTFRTTVQFISTVVLDLEEHEGISLPPDLDPGDWLYDPYLTGNTTIPIYPSGWEQFWDMFGDIFGWIIALVVGAVVIILFVKFGLPLIFNRKTHTKNKKDTTIIIKK